MSSSEALVQDVQTVQAVEKLAASANKNQKYELSKLRCAGFAVGRTL
jgi:hypothetical protein